MLGITVLLGLATYALPSGWVGLQRQDVLPAVQGVAHTGALLPASEKVGGPTKVGEYDGMVPLDCVWSPFWDGLMIARRKGSPSDLEFALCCPNFWQELAVALAELMTTHLKVMPYARRHPETSVGRAQSR